MDIFKSNLQLLKGTRLVSGLFIFASLLVTASIIYSANTYYDIDAEKIIIIEDQDITGAQTITGDMDINSVTGTWDTTTLSLDATDNSNLTVTGSGKTLSLEALGGGVNKVIINSAGTGTDAIDIDATATGGGVDIDTDDGGITLTAGGATNGDITLTAGDDFSLIGVANSIFSIASTGNLAQFIDIGKGTAIDTINIGTGGTSADVIRIGDSLADVALTDAHWSITTAGKFSGVGVDSGAGLIEGIGGLTITGTTNINATGNAATNIGNSTGVLNLDSGGVSSWTNTTGNLTVSTANSGNLIFTSINAIDMNFATVSGFTLGDGTTEHLQISNSGELTLKSANSKDIVIDSGSGKITLGVGDQILTSTDGAASRLKDEQILREVIPIFGFDLPARTKSATFVNVSRVLESDPFPAALTGTTRKYKFIIRYADELDAGTSSWQVDNITVPGSDVAFTIPFSSSTNLDNGDVHIEEVDISAIMTAGNDWQLQVHTEGTKSIQIYSIFLAAYDQVN